MLKIINNTNVPFESNAAGVKVRVPAMGSVDASLDVIAQMMRNDEAFRAMHQGGAIKVLPDEDANVDEEDADDENGEGEGTDDIDAGDEGDAEEEGEGDADASEGGQ